MECGKYKVGIHKYLRDLGGVQGSLETGGIPVGRSQAVQPLWADAQKTYGKEMFAMVPS